MKCPTPITIRDPRALNDKKMMEVPCGKCGSCRHNRRCDWSFRLIQELKVSDNCYFVTLTYTDAQLPTTENGEITLRKKDLQDFMKRLRFHQSKITKIKLRYYAVGEYGTETSRPHYHILLYNLYDNDLIETSWKHGLIHIGEITPASIHYTTKFHVNAKQIENEDIEPEFALMSRKPGIGFNYIQTNGKWNKENLYNFVINNGFKQRIPRYYKEKIFDEYEKLLLKNESNEIIEKTHSQRYKELEEFGYKNPLIEIRKSDIQSAKNVMDKNDKNTF